MPNLRQQQSIRTLRPLPHSSETMLRISLSAALLALVASSSAQNVVGDCADVYDTGTGYCQVTRWGAIHK